MKPDETIDDEMIASRGPNMIAADTGSETVLLDIDSGYFFQLNRSASRIWGLLEEPRTLGDLCAALEKSFAVDSATCRAEVLEFAADMRDKGLIEISA